MNRRDEFWTRVDAELDARRDPLQDAEIQRHIAEEPELFEEFERFESALRDASLAPRRRSRVALLATVVVLTAVGVAAWSIRVTPHDAQLASAGKYEPSRILEFTASVTHVDASGTTTLSFDGVTRTRTFVARDGNVVQNSIQFARAETQENRP